MEYERRVTHRAYVSAGLVALLALGWTTAQPKPWLGISVAPSSQEYGEALADAVRAGSQVYELPQQWKESGSSPNRELLPLVTRLVAAHELRVVLTLNPLDTATNQIPDDLRSRPLDHPESVHRYRRFVDATLASTSELRLLAIAVGNEVDVLLGDDANKWSEYARFFRNARKYLREKAPGVPVGVKLTYDGLMAHRAEAMPIIEESDLAMVTYYPVSGSRARKPSVVGAELARLVKLLAGKPIHLSETGYPSSEKLGSSPRQQARFVDEIFRAWARHPQIALVNFVWLNELTPGATETLFMGRGPDDPLPHFLGSIGLRSHDGARPKPAFRRIREEAKRRRR